MLLHTRIFFVRANESNVLSLEGVHACTLLQLCKYCNSEKKSFLINWSFGEWMRKHGGVSSSFRFKFAGVAFGDLTFV